MQISKNSQQKSKSIKGRYWVFTAWNMSIDWKELYSEYSDLIRYVVVQKEETPTTGRLHWQGYIQMVNQCRRKKIKFLIDDNKANLQLAMGNQKQNRKYCSKDGEFKVNINEKKAFFELGKPCGQGHRSDIEHCKKMLADGCHMLEVADSHFGNYCRYRSSFMAYQAMIEKKKRNKLREVDVTYIHGKTETGKTWHCWDNYHKDGLFMLEFDGKGEWWDGYAGESTIIIDEYNNQMPITRLLRLLDKYPVRLPIKNSHTYANWTRVLITSNLNWNQIHPNAKPEHRAALKRRINNTIELQREPKTLKKSEKCLEVTKGNTETLVNSSTKPTGKIRKKFKNKLQRKLSQKKKKNKNKFLIIARPNNVSEIEVESIKLGNNSPESSPHSPSLGMSEEENTYDFLPPFHLDEEFQATIPVESCFSNCLLLKKNINYLTQTHDHESV